jgi:hypothetical protein
VHPVRVDVVTGERADQGEPAPRPGGGHVQPPLAAVAQQRSPLVAHPAVRVLAVPDGQDDRVPLVALHPLQVLHEERLGPVLGEEALQAGVRPPGCRAMSEVVEFPDDPMRTFPKDDPNVRRTEFGGLGLVTYMINDAQRTVTLTDVTWTG